MAITIALLVKFELKLIPVFLRIMFLYQYLLPRRMGQCAQDADPGRKLWQIFPQMYLSELFISDNHGQ
jgi:hypothetical protein